MQTPIIQRYTSPNMSGEPVEEKGKFLQVTWQQRSYLLFAPKDLHPYHTRLLAHFLTENSIAHRWLDEEKLEVDDPGLTVTGGGKYRITAGQTLELFDNSQAYGRFEEQGLAEQIARSNLPWSRYDVRIL